ncbi:MAG: Gfo/Idh/MocA family oxidoreductase [archaeon]|nr:Gfo/Idh/MocA family oxidoreductase [archaeon]
MKEYKVTFCGCGSITAAWLYAIKRLNMKQKGKYNLKVIAACDPIPSKFKKLKLMGYTEAKTFSDVSLAYEEEKSDITIITSPPQSHSRYIDEAIMNDNHVITEKPLLIDYNQYLHLRKVADIADEKKLHAVANQQYRWNKKIAAIKHSIEEKIIGDIDFIVSNFSQNKYHFNEWWRQQHIDMSQYNWFIHHYDTMRYYLGKNPVTVRAKMHRPRWSKIYGESTIFMNVTFEDGIEWSYTATQEAISGPSHSQHSSFIMYGDKGTIRLEGSKSPKAFVDEGLLKSVGSFKKIKLEKLLKDGDFDDEAEDFDDGKYPPGWTTTLALLIKSIETGVEHPTRIRDNFWTVAIPLCARESHNKGGIPIDVKEYMQFN